MNRRGQCGQQDLTCMRPIGAIPIYGKMTGLTRIITKGVEDPNSGGFHLTLSSWRTGRAAGSFTASFRMPGCSIIGEDCDAERQSANDKEWAVNQSIWDLKPGDRITLDEEVVAEVIAPTEDGEWIRVRYMDVPESPELVGTEDLCSTDEIVSHAA